MTLKEINKIIDESDILIFKKGNKRVFIVIRSQEFKDIEKSQVDNDIKTGHTLIFLKLNDNNDVEKKWLVDHIDEEKKTKTIKKKLDEMSKDEIIQVQERFCEHNEYCHKCPFSYESTQGRKCLRDYWFWKEGVEHNKDKEFEVEVEE